MCIIHFDELDELGQQVKSLWRYEDFIEEKFRKEFNTVLDLIESHKIKNSINRGDALYNYLEIQASKIQYFYDNGIDIIRLIPVIMLPLIGILKRINEVFFSKKMVITK
ncbi:MAG: hypothetical protein P8Q41_08495 [Saprospiraceae bacterium]|nr:hypothetical protein [Saprospiraceae bacterium]